jgi:DNA-binding transcriptional regulator YdaS (Cro superfamily)
VEDTNTNGVSEAIDAAGGQAQLAKVIGCTQQNVSAWKQRGFVPVEHLVAVEAATGVPRTRLIKPQIMELLRPEAF